MLNHNSSCHHTLMNSFYKKTSINYANKYIHAYINCETKVLASAFLLSTEVILTKTLEKGEQARNKKNPPIFIFLTGKHINSMCVSYQSCLKPYTQAGFFYNTPNVSMLESLSPLLPENK